MKAGMIRIIGGKWRGRRLSVPDLQGLRPTPDRVRETLFNWLAGIIPGAHCLDVFAGTGVLGFEALSRGAASVVMVDQSAEAIKSMEETKTLLKANGAIIYKAKAPEQLLKPTQPFEVVFLDPPYQANLLQPICEYLETQGFLAENAYIYLEAKDVIKDNDLPSTWRLIKQQQAGQVAYHLARREVNKHE